MAHVTEATLLRLRLAGHNVRLASPSRGGRAPARPCGRSPATSCATSRRSPARSTPAWTPPPAWRAAMAEERFALTVAGVLALRAAEG